MEKTKSIANENNFFSEWHDGKGAAIQRLFDYYYQPLCKYAYRIVEDRCLVEDIVAESFDKIWRLRNRFDDLNSLLAYLYTITKNASLDQVAFLKKRRTVHQQVAYLADQHEEVIQSKMIRRELLAAILDESESLPPRIKEVFALIYLDGMSPPHAAAKLGVSLNTVKTQQAAGLKKLRVVLQKKYSGYRCVVSKCENSEEPVFEYIRRAKKSLLIAESFMCSMRILLISGVAF